MLRSPLVALLAWALVSVGAAGALAFLDEGRATQAMGLSRAWLDRGAAASVLVLLVGAALAVLTVRRRA